MSLLTTVDHVVCLQICSLSKWFVALSTFVQLLSAVGDKVNPQMISMSKWLLTLCTFVQFLSSMTQHMPGQWPVVSKLAVRNDLRHTMQGWLLAILKSSRFDHSSYWQQLKVNWHRNRDTLCYVKNFPFQSAEPGCQLRHNIEKGLGACYQPTFEWILRMWKLRSNGGRIWFKI